MTELDFFPSRQDAEKAVQTLLSFLREDITREGLKETPRRVVDSFLEHTKGYGVDPSHYLSKTFENIHHFDEVILLKNISFESMCEHHLSPIIGLAHVAYIPNQKIVGISKLARVVETFSKRLQVQEKMTVQISESIFKNLLPQGVAVVIEATHHCISTRGIRKSGVTMVTHHLQGVFKDNLSNFPSILSLIKK
jgi:GTP cyclohydrolase I